ncbi:MAG: cytochrome c oxidase assembly protein [Cellvibrionaceae bacterium]
MAQAHVGKTAAKLVVVAVGMFAFAVYVMPPLYYVFCDILGIDGRGALVAVERKDSVVDESRVIRVTFMATNNREMPWEFRPNDAILEVHPGQVVNTSFFARNTTDEAMISRAIPSFVPSSSAEYFHKVECFCFENQPLAPGESVDMGLQFYLDPDLPKNVTNITASYTIFDITETVSQQKLSQR